LRKVKFISAPAIGLKVNIYEEGSRSSKSEVWVSLIY
jgi:hypothetical protein